MVHFLRNKTTDSVSTFLKNQNNASRSTDGVNRVYSTDFAGDASIPAGTFVSFEDLLGGGDLNYNDEDFVFANVRAATSVPEPSTMLLLSMALIAMGLHRQQRPHHSGGQFAISSRQRV
jgi:hypothetical protein